jgi:hypothetical protein
MVGKLKLAQWGKERFPACNDGRQNQKAADEKA